MKIHIHSKDHNSEAIATGQWKLEGMIYEPSKNTLVCYVSRLGRCSTVVFDATETNRMKAMILQQRGER